MTSPFSKKNSRMKKSKHSTIMVISNDQRTETMRVNNWLLHNMKPTIIALSLLAAALATGFTVFAIQSKKAIDENSALQAKIKELESYNSAEAAAKINELKKTEKTVLQLEEYLEQRGANKPQPKSKTDSLESQPMGGAYRPIAGEIPFTNRYNQHTQSLLEAIQNTPLGAPHDGHLTSRFGNRANPFSGQGAENHPGLDFKAQTGDPIHATANGEVVFAGVMNGYGNVVKIAHKSGYETLFAHMSAINTSLGQKVKAGDVIGKAGNTGRSTGPHLHYEVRLNNEPLDPESFLSFN